MGFDIVVLKLRRTVPSIVDVTDDDVVPLGTPEEIRENCLKVFPAIRWSSPSGWHGLAIAEDESAFEFTIPADPAPSSLHLTYRFGRGTWASERAQFERLMKQLWTDCGWQAFAVSDNSALSTEAR